MKIGLTYNVRQGRSDGSQSSAYVKVTEAPGNWTPGDDDDEEFDSPATISALADVLQGLGHEVLLLGDGEPLLRKLLDGPRPDLVLNIAEGSGRSRSREARVPAVLEMLGIPHTGSDPLTLTTTLDKDCAKRLVRFANIATPNWALIEKGNLAEAAEPLAGLAYPLFAKPTFEGSSKGVLARSVIRGPDELTDAVARLYEVYQQPILVEEFIIGDELTVGLVGNDPVDVIGIMRVLPRQPRADFIYSLEIKRDWEHLVRYECPARLAESDTEAVRRAALACWRALGCRDVSRFDFRLRDGVPYFLEVNPLPGLSPTSGDLVIMANQVGVDYPELIARIVRAASDRIQQDRNLQERSRSIAGCAIASS